MLWGFRRFNNWQLPYGVRWKGTSRTVARASVKEVQKTTSNIDQIHHLIQQVNPRDLLRASSTKLLQLGKIIDSVGSGHEMRQVKNILQRTLDFSYVAVFNSLLKVVADPALFRMSMFRRLGWKQYCSFASALRMTIGDKELSNEQKKQKLYRIISFQHDLFPRDGNKAGFQVPTEVHRWFWENLPREESFDHLYFMIKNDVLLSSCPYVWNFSKRLMQGSEVELQLATFEIFLHDKAHQATFTDKFGKLHCFYAMNKLTRKLLSDRDFRFIKLYLASLLQKLESLKERGQSSVTKTRIKHLIQFNNTLMFYLSQTGNVEMFLKPFEMNLRYMRNAGLLRDSRPIQEYLHPSLHFVLRLLRQKGLQEQVFQFIRVLQRVVEKKSPAFNARIVGELVTSLRSFNDPKLSCQYILSAFDTERTAFLLNDLGLWAPIFHHKPGEVSKQVLDAEIKTQETIFPPSLQIKQTPTMPIMTELYRVLLSTSARTMGRESYQDFILGLYSAYKKTLERRRFGTMKHDTGILSVLLHHIRLELNNSKLAFEVLTDFYSQDFASSVRCTTKACPFSYVVYKNYDLSQSDVSRLLHLMQLNRAPLQFRFCTAMVLRYLNLDNVEEAHSWYKKILHAGFEVNHAVLIRAITENGWEYPKNFDMSLLHTTDQRMPYSNEDALLMAENSELEDPSDYAMGSENSLLEAINLVEQLQPIEAEKPSV